MKPSKKNASSVVVVALGLTQRGLEGVEVEVELAMLIGQLELIEAPAGTHAGTEGVALEVGERSVSAEVGHVFALGQKPPGRSW